VYIIRTRRRNEDWQDAHTLFLSAAEAVPGNHKMLLSAGIALNAVGRSSEALSFYGRASKADIYKVR
jgi:hypothetical protein